MTEGIETPDPFGNWYPAEERPWYDVAQVCLHGHLINDRTKTDPQNDATYCPTCGAASISQCPACNATIRGDIHYPNAAGPSEYVRAAFCYNCGTAMPWTSDALEAARTLASEIDELSVDERDQLAGVSEV